MPEAQRILVIKLSALGDFVLSLGAMQAIRRHHPKAHLVLLTTRPFEKLARASGLFQEVWLDSRPRLWQVGALLALRRKLRGGRFDRVYDLQRADRTGWYFRLLGRPRPEWVGKASGASHRYRQPPPPLPHIAEREAAQLALAGVPRPQASDLSFLAADVGRFRLAEPYALLVPGGAPHRPAKRWPAASYGGLARWLAGRGIQPVLLGTGAEREELDTIARLCPEARNLGGETSLEEIAVLARGAVLAVGNDTGPMHLAAAAGAPLVSLFSAISDPALVAPRGRQVLVLRRDDLRDLPLAEVTAAAERLLATGERLAPAGPQA